MTVTTAVPICVVPKLWGREEWLVNSALYCAKWLLLNRGFVSSLHYHICKDETFFVVEGACLVMLEGMPHELDKGRSLHIPPKLVHSFRSLTDTCRVLEVSTHHEDADVVRITPSCNIMHS